MSTQTAATPGSHFRRGWIYVLTAGAGHDQLHGPFGAGRGRAVGARRIQSVSGEMGYLFSSFLWTYVICLLPIGIMLDRFAPRNINSAGITLWSLAMIATAGVWSFATLMLTRLVMGAGEATSIPSCGRIVREWMPARSAA